MSNENMALWQRVSKTDPAAVKPITGKQYSGNSPKPYYIVQRLTEEFGPCGIGWGFTILNERMERLTETDVLHVAVVQFWYVMGGQKGELVQIGQTKAVYEKSKGGLLVDEDAPKKSVTDALVKCASYLGFAGDIFSGRWDDSKYVAELRREFAEQAEEKTAPRHAPVSPPKRGAHADTLAASGEMPADWKAYLEDLANRVCVIFDANGEEGPRAGYELIAKENLEDTQKLYLSSILPSGVRNPIKAFSQMVHAKKRESSKATSAGA